MLGWVGLVQSQTKDVVNLTETRVTANPMELVTNSWSNSLEFEVPEEYAGQFQENPVAFVASNFPIHDFIDQNKKKKYDSYEVTMRSRKGFITADYNRTGEMVSTYQKFKNINLPYDEIVKLHKDFRGWSVVKTLHVATTYRGDTNKEFYKVKLENGNKKRKIRIDINENDTRSIAGF